MINRELLLTIIAAFPSEFMEFAHAYGCYRSELERTKKDIIYSGKERKVKEESAYNPNLIRMINWSSSTLFKLNSICKDTKNSSFIYGYISSNEEKEELINEAFDIITSKSFI